MYNQIGRQRMMQATNVKGAFQYLRDIGNCSGPMFWSHTIDNEECGLEENTWVKEMYEKRRMWASCYIRGQFFAGIRTTSRCEGLHAQLGRFVHSRNALVDFLQNYHHCLEYFRYKEIEADYRTLLGEPVLQTNLHALERSASRMFTKEIFKLFRPALSRGSTVMVKSCRELMSQTIYTVSKYGRPNKEWCVSYLAQPLLIRCSCKRMESFGLPCEHIVGVLVHLNINEIPSCIVLDRWTMVMKEKLYELCDQRSSIWDSVFMARCGCLDALSRKVNRLAAKSTVRFNAMRDLLTEQLKKMEDTDEGDNEENEACNQSTHRKVRDLVRVGSKGCAVNSSPNCSQKKRRQKCGLCGEVGHNRKTCLLKSNFDHGMMSQEASSMHYEEFDNCEG
ncbi:Zinc finger, PMZ-type [Sesbania bispinosa]|nr:Zinc finger, PMZ-type [Sesbania bispinosa]